MLDARGNLTPLWLRWFEEVSKVYDKVRKVPDHTYTSNTTLSTNDFGKTILFSIGTSNVTARLPVVEPKDLYAWITIYRRGTGRLSITAAPGTRIEYASSGGTYYCDEARRAAANLTLQLVDTDQWGIIGGTGLWLAD